MNNAVYSVGVFAGKFSPPHRGHLQSIFQAATRCQTLFVVVSYHSQQEQDLYKKAALPEVTLEQRLGWLRQELEQLPHVRVTWIREEGLPPFPKGWPIWYQRVEKAVGSPFQVIFGGEKLFSGRLPTLFDGTQVEYQLLDSQRREVPISGTQIREQPYRHWEYMLPGARSFFARKVLIVGPPGAGKSSLAIMLAAVFQTTWVPVLTGAQSTFSVEQALACANRVVFFDSGSDIKHPVLPADLSSHPAYDLVLDLGEEGCCNLYQTHKNKPMIAQLSASYSVRLEQAIRAVRDLLGEW